MLSVLNAVLISCLAVIVALNIYFLMRLQYTQAYIREELEKKVNDMIHTMDLTDLKEFNSLEDNMKDYYKTYFANVIIPLLVKNLSVMVMTTDEYAGLKDKAATKKKMDAFISEVKKQLDAYSVQFIAAAAESQHRT